MTRFQNCYPPVYSAEGDFAFGPGWKPEIGDEVVGVDDVQAGPLQQLALVLRL
jgi:hypothetical protein